MTKHLTKCHGVFDTTQARTLARAWLRDSGRRFWSCGLCVDLFLSLQERLRHIDVEHFRQHQPIETWSLTNVILGLLRQRDVKEAWHAHMTAYHGWEHPEVAWVTSDVEDVQLRLEMGPSEKHSAVALAEAAYNVSIIRTSDAWNVSSGSAEDHDGSTRLSHALSTQNFLSASSQPNLAQTSTSEYLDLDTLHTPIPSGTAAGERVVADATIYQSLSDGELSFLINSLADRPWPLPKLIRDHTDTASRQSTDPFLFLSTEDDASLGTEQWWNCG